MVRYARASLAFVALAVALIVALTLIGDWLGVALPNSVASTVTPLLALDLALRGAVLVVGAGAIAAAAASYARE
jgi:hypothetical protein